VLVDVAWVGVDWVCVDWVVHRCGSIDVAALPGAVDGLPA